MFNKSSLALPGDTDVSEVELSVVVTATANIINTTTTSAASPEYNILRFVSSKLK